LRNHPPSLSSGAENLSSIEQQENKEREIFRSAQNDKIKNFPRGLSEICPSNRMLKMPCVRITCIDRSKEIPPGTVTSVNSECRQIRIRLNSAKTLSNLRKHGKTIFLSLFKSGRVHMHYSSPTLKIP
jgi:hypothetical protein